jgi:cytochrome c oxidase subunit III
MTDLEDIPILPTKRAARTDDLNSLGMWLFLIGEVMFFGALFTGYTVYRITYPGSFSEASRLLDLPYGTLNTAILLTSSLTVALAVNSAQRDLRRSLVLFLLATILLGSIFLGIKGLEYIHKIEQGLFPAGAFAYPGANPEGARLFFSLYFIMTGLHAVHMIGGILVIGLLAFRAWRGHFSARHYAPVELLGLYWHFVDIVWIFLFPMFYLIDRT